MTALSPATLRRITRILALYLPVSGIVQAFLPFLSDDLAFDRGMGFRSLQLLFPPLNLQLLQFNFFVHVDEMRSLSFDLAELIFFSFFLLSSLFYLFKRESRLLQFCLAITLFGSASSTLYVLTGFLVFMNTFTVGLIVLSFVELFVCLGLTYLLWQSIRWLRSPARLATVVDHSDVVPESRYVQATRWQRWAHTLIDQTICLLLMAPLVFWALYLTRSERFDFDVDTWPFYLLLYILMVLYYTFFESLFGITPAKLLTGTIVTDESGNKPKPSAILRRSLSRLVPFDGLSFLGVRGWHDDWSDTYVLQEERSGMPVRANLFLLPFLALLSYGCWAGMRAYSDHNENSGIRNRYAQERAGLRKRFESMDNGGILELKLQNRYNERTTFLVLRSREGEEMIFDKVLARGTYSAGDLAEMKAVYQSGGPFEQLRLKPEIIRALVDRSYDEKEKGLRLMGNEDAFTLAAIFAGAGPEFMAEQSGSIYGEEENKTVSITLRNGGDGGRVTSLRSLEPGMTWTAENWEVDDAQSMRPAYLRLSGTGFVYNRPYSFDMTLSGNDGRTYHFRVRGRNLNYVVERLD